jgi:excisionase family DNA binding protein
MNYLTIKELANHLKCSVRTVHSLIKKGIPSVKISRRIRRFKLDEVDRWLEAGGADRPKPRKKSGA